MADNKQSRLAALRSKFEAGPAFVPTPEHQFGRMKKSQEEQARAVRVAKARAARYNMTLRALAIKTTTDVTKMQKNDEKSKKVTKQEAAKYNATARALNVQAGMTAKDSRNLSKSFGNNVAPSIAKEVLTEVAKRQVVKATPKPVPTTTYVPHVPKASQPTQAVEEDVPTDDESEPEHKQSAKIENKGLQQALAAGDENQLNKAILNDFLEANAPHLLGKADVFLDQFKDEMHVLFKKLLKKYPDAPDAEIAGEQKADKEIEDAQQQQAPHQAEEDDDDESMVFDEENIEKYDPETDGVADMKFADHEKLPNARKPEVEAVEEDDDDSLVIEAADKEFQASYEKAIQEAETSGPEKALARRKSSKKVNAELEKEVEKYKNDDDDSFQSVISDDSLVQLDADAVPEGGGYIVATEVTPAKKEEEGRWAVHFQHKNLALKEKLMKQGLPTNQVAKMIGDLDTYTSDMI